MIGRNEKKTKIWTSIQKKCQQWRIETPRQKGLGTGS